MSDEHLGTADGHRRLRVAAADPSPLVMEAAIHRLSRDGRVSVLAQVTSAPALLRMIDGNHPDVVIIDPLIDGGIDAIAAIAGMHPRVVIIALGDGRDVDGVDGALAAGADGYIAKDVPADDFAPLVRRICAGMTVRPRHNGAAGPVHALTRRERQVLALLADGLPNKQIARQLFVTEQTVKFHLANIYRKLGVQNRTQAARRAVSLVGTRRVAQGGG